MKNIEIKAKVDDINKIEKKAKELSDTEMVVIKQHDTFFNILNEKSDIGGRLKLREFEDSTGELIYYQRPNIEGPKLSSYSKITLDSKECMEMKEILTQANGILGIVKKTRHLYMIGNTRIHIDRVDGLGNYLEFEVCLRDDEIDAAVKGKKIADDLLEKFEIKDDSLLSGAYMDIILNK